MELSEDNKENVKGTEISPISEKNIIKSNVVWHYERSKGDWVYYTEDIIEKLNNAKEDDVVSVNVEEADLDIDMKTMKQINMISSFRRSVRCCVQTDNDECILWEAMRGRMYVPLPRSLQVEFEKQKSDGQETFKINYADDEWEVNLLDMEMKNQKGTRKKLRRQECTAESAISAVPTVTAVRTRGLTKRSLKSVEYKTEVKEEIDDDEYEEAPAKKGKKSAGDVKPSKSSKKSIKSNSDFYKSTKRVVLVKGRAPVDPECTEKVSVAHVLDEGNTVWDAMLNQTNISQNNNKFYILQLLEDDKAKSYSVWFRWGRVGYRGQSNLQNFGECLDEAKKCFCKKFRDKTYNDWSERHEFERVPGKYTLIEMDYKLNDKKEENDSEVKKEEDDGEDDTGSYEESKLDERVRSFMALLCNRQTMEEAAMEMEYDSAKAPLGKLTETQIEEGYRLLADIEKFIADKKFGREFLDAVNEYYTKIPHNFGFRQPPLIKTNDMLKKENELLEFLQEIEIAIRILGSGKKKGDRRDPVDRYYDNMNCDITAVEEGDEEYKMVEKYLKTNHASTHMYSMNIVNIFKVKKDEEEEKFKTDIGNRMLLWHGSRLTNFYGILSKGLRIAPPEAPTCGYMFGKGIYFADMASKSGNYCYPASGKPGVLLLSEVALGNPRTLRDADYQANKLPKGTHSTFGEGRTIPKKEQHATLDDGLVVPCGKPVKREDDGNYSLLYNEYVVYDTAQVKMKYVVEVEFDM